MTSDQGLLIDGEQQESATGETYEDINPYTGDAIATVAAAAPADATRAVAAAAAAFKAWSQASPPERRAVFLRAAQLVKERASDVATMTPETGATFGRHFRGHPSRHEDSGGDRHWPGPHQRSDCGR
jgi:vanillin dehydrogenase